MNIPDFIQACDAFCEKHGVTRVWLSKKLLADTYRLDRLSDADASTDIGVKRLEKAASDLAKLDAEMTAGQAGAAA